MIQWHVVGMYAPGFVTGSLIRRFGVLNVILAGIALVAACVAVALNGITVTHFLVALALLGVGWNFMYTGGTTLLTESYCAAGKGAHAGRERLYGVRDDGRLVARVGRDGVDGRLGGDEPRDAAHPRGHGHRRALVRLAAARRAAGAGGIARASTVAVPTRGSAPSPARSTSGW